MLEGLRGEQSVAELYYRWSKDFLEAGKKQLAGDTVREAISDDGGPLVVLEPLVELS